MSHQRADNLPQRLSLTLAGIRHQDKANEKRWSHVSAFPTLTCIAEPVG